MGEIKGIVVEIIPEYFSRPHEEPIMRCTIIVKVFGKPDYQMNEIIPDNDFQARFDWFIKRAVGEIKKGLRGGL